MKIGKWEEVIFWFLLEIKHISKSRVFLVLS